ncbi:hypothetical protein [Brevundimonas sp. FT23028]|uniref:hypothetical protein n=1 Tax=Brevundimonas sp. FT23028 TaxID=3393748 RepID=UPI003B58703A
MKTTVILTCCAAIVAGVAPVAAQVPGAPARPRTPQVDMAARYGSSIAENQSRLAAQIADPNNREGMSDAERDRLALLERIAPLVAEGRCNDARQMARDVGDRAVSRRIGQVCTEGRPTAMPAE